MEKHCFVRKANYYETDQMAIVHHSNYIRWLEEARIDFLEKAGFPYTRIEENDVYIAVTGVNCHYKGMVRFGDTVHIECKVTQCSHARMAVAYIITDAETGDVRFTGETQHGFINAAGRPVSLKRNLPQLFQIFQEIIQQD